MASSKARQKFNRLVRKHGLDVDVNADPDGVDKFEFDVCIVAPDGMRFKASDCHCCVTSGEQSEAPNGWDDPMWADWFWNALIRDIEDGIETCDCEDCAKPESS